MFASKPFDGRKGCRRAVGGGSNYLFDGSSPDVAGGKYT
jgi:hypothetical protein